MNKKDILMEKLAAFDMNAALKTFQQGTKGKAKGLGSLIEQLAGSHPDLAEGLSRLGSKGSVEADKAVMKKLRSLLSDYSKKNAPKLPKVTAPSMMDATTKAISEKPGELVNPAGAGAVLGAGAGALTDNDTETTNIMGIKTKNPGSLTDRLESMATGALGGAAIGAAGRGAAMGKGKVVQEINAARKAQEAAKGLTQLGKGGNDVVIQQALKHLTPEQLSTVGDDIFRTHSKFYGQDFGEGRAAIQKGLNDIGSMKSVSNVSNPDNYGTLERGLDKVKGLFGRGRNVAAASIGEGIVNEAPTVAQALGIHGGTPPDEIMKRLTNLNKIGDKVDPTEVQNLKRFLMGSEAQGSIPAFTPSSWIGKTNPRRDMFLEKLKASGASQQELQDLLARYDAGKLNKIP